jgi:hypothetical protein
MNPGSLSVCRTCVVPLIVCCVSCALSPALSPLCVQELCEEVPGLFSLGPKGELLVGQARQHEKQLEKVRTVFWGRGACVRVGSGAGVGIGGSLVSLGRTCTKYRG